MSVSVEQVNGLVLRRQHLTEDAKADDLAGMADDICGLHATSATAPYISSFLRLKAFKREDLDEALYVRKRLGRIRCVRTTMYVQPVEAFAVYHSALAGILWRESESQLRRIGLSAKEYDGLKKEILGLLGEKGMTAQELKKALGTTANLFLVLVLMCDMGLLAKGPPKGSWKSSLHTYHRFDKYYPGVPLAMDEGRARGSLVLRYLKAFGPASEDDIAWWTGLSRPVIRDALEGLGEEVSHADVAEVKNGLMIASADLKPLRETRPLSKPLVRLLPSLDPYLMGYRDRERYLAREFYDYIYDRSGNGTSTVLVGGRLAGVWDVERNGDAAIKYFLFEEADEATKKEIGRQAQAMGDFLVDGPMRARECDSMVPLPRRPPGAVMSPLRERSDL